MFEPFVSLDQSYHLAPLYSVKGMNDVAPIEHGKQTFHHSLRIPAVFPQDANKRYRAQQIAKAERATSYTVFLQRFTMTIVRDVDLLLTILGHPTGPL